MLKLVSIFTLLIGVPAYAQGVKVKKIDKERQEQIKGKYLGTGVGEKKAEEDKNYGVQENISELGTAFDSFAKRIEAQQKNKQVEVIKDLPETMFDYTQIGTWQEAARASMATDGVSK